MKHIFLFLAVFLQYSLKSQNFEKTEKIIFHYKIGHYNFLNSGNYGKEEIIEFTKNKNGELEANNYTQIENSYIFNNISNKNDLKKDDSLRIKTRIIFDKIFFNILINELNSTKSNIDEKEILALIKKPNEKEILFQAKKDDIEYYLIDEKTNRIDEFGKEKIKQIRKLYGFEDYLKSFKLNTDVFTITNDAWNNLEITFFEGNNKIQYQFNFLNLDRDDHSKILGQPFSKITNSNASANKMFINFNVNRIIYDKLPYNSLIKTSLDFNNLKKNYIYWFLKNNPK